MGNKATRQPAVGYNGEFFFQPRSDDSDEEVESDAAAAGPSQPGSRQRQPSHRADRYPREPQVGDVFVGVYNFQGRTEPELSFERGEKLTLLRRLDENWWLMRSQRSGKEGYAPSNYIAPFKDINRNPWYHSNISRNTAEYLLKSGVDGSFLVRESLSSPGEYSITLRCDGKARTHYRINHDARGYFVAAGKFFATVEQLVAHHAVVADGLVACLKQHPVEKAEAKPLVLSKEEDEQWEIARSEIVLGHRLGEGQYGEVYVGEWGPHRVAIKTIKDGAMEAKDFMKEADIMKRMRHPNLVRLLGVCTRGGPLFIVTEFMNNGNLLDFLQSERGRAEIDPTSMMHCALQIAEGMSFLEEKHFIHRDLAARNCLVGDNLQIKLADFGLARFVSSDFYEAAIGSKFPIKWTAPESLSLAIFTIKSDVWAFGVTLWEIATYGSAPYPGIHHSKVLDKLMMGYRMQRPEGCPMEIYNIMLQCWDVNPDLRPSFHKLKRQLQSLYGNSSIEAEFPTSAPADAVRVGVSEGAEIRDLTKRIMTQACFLLENQETSEFLNRLNLLIVDTQQLMGACGAVLQKGQNVEADQAMDSLRRRLQAINVAAMHLSQHVLNEEGFNQLLIGLQKVAGAAKAVAQAVKASS
ncbi:uncharacterized protein MONBRDRAFT_44322 [Monosiga brevicollis MX1]|uniref:non-specific protein-tyrosine kinase n=1 Tax=Monosiga brevicollis TaxID=81824 RepID=A9UQ58_MONBE|nr:uncharacterized protein MONBRDRAFT_44322 [Monosiga brevicollis MX1]EDQ92991.1 predicted protein [Monosiga brevicollis MX1]|eukprot:XP_001742753.1 hypothetical protein [Monosiga brevicollis MX1]